MVHGYTSLTTLSLSPLSSSDATHFYIAITMHISTPVHAFLFLLGVSSRAHGSWTSSAEAAAATAAQSQSKGKVR